MLRLLTAHRFQKSERLATEVNVLCESVDWAREQSPLSALTGIRITQQLTMHVNIPLS